MSLNKLCYKLCLLISCVTLSGCATVHAQEQQALVVPTLVTPVVREATSTPIPIDFTPEVAETQPVPTSTTLPTPSLVEGEFLIGESVNGEEIAGWRLRGSDEANTSIVLIGGIHGGYEANTIVLGERLLTYFRVKSSEILPEVELIIIPNANPDGLATGRNLSGRFNANGVDLNRNWGCDWSDTAYLGQREVDPGPRPFSEPESVALREFFIAEDPEVVIFYHSSLGGVFLGECGGGEAAIWLGETLSEATGYPLYEDFTFYQVTGDASNWLAERGIPAAIIELYTSDDAEFDANLAGVMAVQCLYGTPDTDAYERICS